MADTDFKMSSLLESQVSAISGGYSSPFGGNNSIYLGNKEQTRTLQVTLHFYESSFFLFL